MSKPSWLRAVMNSVDDGPRTLELRANAIERAPDAEELASDVERTKYEVERAKAAHEHALQAWRKHKTERGLE
jgi:hypothetical protein